MNTRKRWPEGTWMRLRSSDTLRALMAQSDMSFKDLADYVGCSKGFISHLLAGRRTSCKPETARRIAGVLHVPVDVLFMPKLSTSSTPVDLHKVSA
jgi:transcriptional regulator with XRE-family HTH domain